MTDRTRHAALVLAGIWFGLTSSVVAAAAYVRFSRPYLVPEQIAVQTFTVAECALATLALTCSLPLIARTGGSRHAAGAAAAAIVLPVTFVFVLLILGIETPGENREKNLDYLTLQADVLASYWSAKGRMPESFDRALEWSQRPDVHRDDADGQPVTYNRLSRSEYLICAPRPRLHLRIDEGTIHVSGWTPAEHDPCWADPPHASPHASTNPRSGARR